MELNEDLIIFIIPVYAASANPSLSKTKLTLYAGRSYTLKAEGFSGKITWKTSDKKVAVVSIKGKVTAKKAGTVTLKAVKTGKAVITATYKNKTYKCVVTVKKKAQPSVTPTPTIAPEPEPTTIPYDTGNAKEILLPPIP